MLTITIPGEPIGKGRPKFSRAAGRAYTPAKTVNAEAWAKACAYEQVGQPLLQGPLSVTLEAVFTIPASWGKAKTEAALAGEVMHTSRPDADNVTKQIFDALNGIVWKDDSQIVQATVTKRYGPAPQVVLTVEPYGARQIERKECAA